jgi:hypothetical protein
VNWVFLDIDGVLNTPDDYARWCNAKPSTFGPDDQAELLFNPQLVARLNRITEAASAQIVVSSSWRLYYSGCGNPEFSDLYKLLRRVGVRGYIFGPTPLEFPERWSAIEKWVSHNGLSHDRIAILDDDVPHNEWRWKARHVHCRALPGGLTEANEQQAIRLLTEE